MQGEAVLLNVRFRESNRFGRRRTNTCTKTAQVRDFSPTAKKETALEALKHDFFFSEEFPVELVWVSRGSCKKNVCIYSEAKKCDGYYFLTKATSNQCVSY